ncbi:MAG TPA: hypothetical protein VKI41_07375 [Vicinamibacteria bacterium]|nr:hypothetical protein [Vicinamibacteria bacterium]
MAASRDITELLVAWGEGDRAALNQPTPLDHDEGRGVATAHLAREGRGHILQTAGEALRLSPPTEGREGSTAKAQLSKELGGWSA